MEKQYRTLTTDEVDDVNSSKKIYANKNKNKSDFENFEVELSHNKKVTITSFKGKKYIDIREYYDKDGESLPGKKGIALTHDMWNKLKQNIELIDEAYEAK